jgi:GTPase SAR1 family protein
MCYHFQHVLSEACAAAIDSCYAQLYDLGGGRNIRRIWGVYAPEVHGVIYVVDSADTARFTEAHSALQQLLAAPQLAGKPLLLFANKQDLPGAQPLEAVTAAMGLQELQAQQSNPCTAIACTAKGAEQQQQADPALRQGLQWLQQTIRPLYGQLLAKIEKEAAAAKAEEEQRRQERQERARQSKLAREKQEQGQQQAEQQNAVQVCAQHDDTQAEQRQQEQQPAEQQLPEQLIKANWTHAEHDPQCEHQQVLPSQLACLQPTASYMSAAAVPGCADESEPQSSDANAAAPASAPVAAASMCISSTTASSGMAGLPSLPDQQCCELWQPAAAAAAGEAQPPNKPGMATSLLNLLQAAVFLPGSATAAPPAAPDFCDLRQAAHDLCGPTPRSLSISSDTSSLLVSEASQQLRPMAKNSASSMQQRSQAASAAAAAGSRRVSGTGGLPGGRSSRTGSSSSRRGSAQVRAASQAPRIVARTTSLPVPSSSLQSSSSSSAGHGSGPRRTTSNGRTSVGQGNKVQPIA